MKNFVFRPPSIFIACHFSFTMKYITAVIEIPLNEKCRQNFEIKTGRLREKIYSPNTSLFDS